ncbi:5-dehydro-4-deoxyglucarate dehydratase [Hirschia baltica]|uniref:Probable 5-dehydro-4-deoxyglucarate dehydratase n=1 Tax=Hirschia baltica (strain ATCC 49814 / DSM 5838 / IFAM 1418) TaxID=582402 RepID=C6XNZ8_HIRBI|nr:5-dehydro-4-deoxyglucarate dehydratase [Hirschia baltica]ACT60178.1 5-dehydro-4-deoxyglucarate dehydratase [Hirschia baltica ATCC 49814]
MHNASPREMAHVLGSGLLSFPVTHFDEAGHFNSTAYKEHCEYMLSHELSGVFAAGGTGEFFSLRPEEVDKIVRATVDVVRGKTPVIAGCGYGTAIATDLAQNAEKAGADGILLLPPYLMFAGQQGLYDHIEAVCRSTKLGVIVYNRDNGVIDEVTLDKLCDRNPNLIGFKDGVGDIELMMRIYARMGDRLTYIGGLPTAETFAPAYLEMGVTTYSSAIFNFVPSFATKFYKAVRAKDHDTIMEGLKTFVLPYIALRNEGKGYAVSIVKAGMKAIGRPAGPVRSPLTDLNEDQIQRLKLLIDKVS